MKNKIHRMLVLGTVILCCLLWAGGASAQEGDGFSDTFDDTTLTGWEHSQNVRVVEGVLRMDPDNFAFRNGIWQDPDLSVRIRFSLPGGVLLHYHATDQGVYRVALVGEGDHIEVRLEKEQAGESSSLGSAVLSDINPGDWNTVRLVFSQGQHTIHVNDQQVIQVLDDTPLAAGAIGFLAVGENPVDIDDLVVSAAHGIPVEGGAPQEGAPEGAPEGEPVGEPQTQGEEPLPPASVQTTPMVTPQPGAGTRSLLEELFVSGANPLDMQTFALNLGLAALLSFILGRVYILWGASLSNRRKFAANFMLITITTTFIILVVRSSVALSLGLVGALSIVRFRAAIKEPEELAYLFLAIGLGIGLGDNQRMVTILAFTAAILMLGLMNVFRHARSDVNMHLNIAASPSDSLTLDGVMAALEPHCAKLKLLRYDENEKGMEVSFLVELRELTDLSQARAALQSLSPQVSITFMDNKGIW